MGLRQLVILVGLNLVLSTFAFAQNVDPYSVPQPTAVENKLFEPSRELNLQLGLLPLDAFYKAILLNVNYTHYLQSYYGWEVLNINAAFNRETDLRKDLRQFSAQTASFLDYVRYAATTNLVYTPIYNKNLLFNRSVVHGEISGVVGGGLVAFESEDIAPMFGGGMILRFFSSERWSYKLDNRAYYHLGNGKSTNIYLAINLGFAYEFDPGGKRNRRTK